MDKRKKASIIIRIVFICMAVILLIACFIVDKSYPELIPVFTAIVKIYSCFVPVIIIVKSLLEQKILH